MIVSSSSSVQIDNPLGDSRSVVYDENAIDDIFRELNQCHLPGAAVGIAIGGKPVYRKGFGVANMDLPIVLSPTIRMSIMSITKHFAALAYMLFCEKGNADIDDPVGKYLPDLHPITRGVTARQLMGNMSGLRDVFDITWHFSGTGRRIGSEDLLSLYRELDDANAPPVTNWIYNNGGWLLLSCMIERIAESSLEEVLRSHIFQPVGMYDTVLRRFDTDFLSNCASPHMTNEAGNYEKAFFGSGLAGESGMVSTVDDLLRWLVHMDAPVVGNELTWAMMRTPQRLANGMATGYGFGLVVDRYRGIETLSHSGVGMGCTSRFVKVPALGLDVVVLVNREDASALSLADKVVDSCVPSHRAIEPSQSAPADGTFRSLKTGRICQLFCVKGRRIASIDGTDMPVEPDDYGVLWPVGAFRHVKQAITLVGDPRTPASIWLSDFGNVDELVREQLPIKTDAAAITGCYRSSTTHTEAWISKVVGGAQLLTTGRFGSAVYQLECLAVDSWRLRSKSAMHWSGILSFDSDGAAFHFSSSCTRSLKFTRYA